MGVGHIKVIFEVIPASFRVKHRNPPAVLIDPTLKLLIPRFQSGNGNRIGTLGVYQKLLVKAAFIIAAGRS